jgi:hypothetical protein
MMTGAGRCCNNQCYAQSYISFAAFADFLLNYGAELEVDLFWQVYYRHREGCQLVTRSLNSELLNPQLQMYEVIQEYTSTLTRAQTIKSTTATRSTAHASHLAMAHEHLHTRVKYSAISLRKHR